MSEFLDFPVKNRQDWLRFKQQWLDPDDPRRVEVLLAGPHGLSHPRLPDDKCEQDDQNHRNGENKYPLHGNGKSAQMDEQIRKRGFNPAGIRTEQQDRPVHEKHGQSHGGEDHVFVRLPLDGSEGKPLDEETKHPHRQH